MSERASKINQAGPIDGGNTQQAADFAKAANLMFDGWTALGGQMLDYTKTTFDAGLAVNEALRRCRTPQEVVDVQMRFARENYERTLGEVNRMSSVMSRMSSDLIDAMTPPPA